MAFGRGLEIFWSFGHYQYRLVDSPIGRSSLFYFGNKMIKENKVTK